MKTTGRRYDTPFGLNVYIPVVHVSGTYLRGRLSSRLPDLTSTLVDISVLPFVEVYRGRARRLSERQKSEESTPGSVPLCLWVGGILGTDLKIW